MKYYCSTCSYGTSRRFKTEDLCKTHIRKTHPKKGGTPIPEDEQSGESMADLFLEGELNRSMGIANPDWLEDMLP